MTKSTDNPGKEYSFVAHFDWLHDMGDSVGAQNGPWMIVKPFANERVEDNLNRWAEFSTPRRR